MTGRSRLIAAGLMRTRPLATENPGAGTEEREHSGSLDWIAEDPTRCQSHGAAPRLPGSSGGDAAVYRVEHDEHTSRLETVFERLRDVFGEPLLELRPRGKSFNHTRYLAKSDDALRGDIRNMRNSGKRKQVVLADRTEVNVAQKHQLAQLIASQIQVRSARKMGQRINSEPAEEVGVGLRNPSRRGRKSGTRRILANCGEDLGDGSLDAPSVDGSHGC